MANVKIRVLYGYRGLITKNVYLPEGVHGVTQAQADYLVEHGHAELIETPTPEPEQTDETPKRKIAKTKRKKSDAKE